MFSITFTLSYRFQISSFPLASHANTLSIQIVYHNDVNTAAEVAQGHAQMHENS